MLTDREKFIAIVNNDLIRKSDVIILLEGDGLNRYQHAVRLYKENYAPLIVFSGGIKDHKYGSFPYEEIEPLIRKEGVCEEVLYYENRSLHTRQQAEEVFKLSVLHNWKKMILVASPYHQYRAYLTFLKVIFEMESDLVLYNAPATNLKWFDKNPWGRRFDCLQSEFERIAKYSALGHLATFNEAIKYQEWKESQ